MTVSHLRFGKNQIKASYYVTKANFVACHLASYIEKFDIVQDIKPGGTFLLNCSWNQQELEEHLPAAAKRYLAQNHIRLFTCDATHKAIELGMGNRSNTILQAAFFKLGDRPLDGAHRQRKLTAELAQRRQPPAGFEVPGGDRGFEVVDQFLVHG